MWAMVLIDVLRDQCVISRDRLEIKPLFCWQNSQLIAFASEIRGFKAIDSFVPEANLKQIHSYINTGYEDQHASLIDGVTPCESGTFQTIPFNVKQPKEIKSYWNINHIMQGWDDPKEASRSFVTKCEESVRLHLRSDVPLGCALSGGMDSGSIAMMVDRLYREERKSLNTFSCVFPGMRIDESYYINTVLLCISARPFFVTPQREQFLKDFDRFIVMQDEPLGSLSVYAGYCIAKMTREVGVRVTLNGQDGDEIVLGYWQ
jgi:asparagine synthase (glutamine-hydrolysing)